MHIQDTGFEEIKMLKMLIFYLLSLPLINTQTHEEGLGRFMTHIRFSGGLEGGFPSKSKDSLGEQGRDIGFDVL